MVAAKGAELQDLVFGILERAAGEGRRCPTNFEVAAELNAMLTNTRRAGTSIPAIMQVLVRRGLLTVRLYGGNYRDVVILKGPHAGKATLGPRHGGPPYEIIDKAERDRRDKSPKWQRR